jgi:hypothetical protein
MYICNCMSYLCTCILYVVTGTSTWVPKILLGIVVEFCLYFIVNENKSSYFIITFFFLNISQKLDHLMLEICLWLHG